MAYRLTPIDDNPMKQQFFKEADEFEGLMPKVAEDLGKTVGVPASEVVVSAFDNVINGDVQLEVVDFNAVMD